MSWHDTSAVLSGVGAAMQKAFDKVGPLPMARIQGFRIENQEAVDGEVRRREERRSRSASQVRSYSGDPEIVHVVSGIKLGVRTVCLPGLLVSACAAGM